MLFIKAHITKNVILAQTLIVLSTILMYCNHIAPKNSEDFFEHAHASIQNLENTLDNARLIINHITCISSHSEHIGAWFERYSAISEDLAQKRVHCQTLEMQAQWLWHCTYLARSLTRALYSQGSDLENLDALAEYAAAEYFLELVTDAHIEKAYKKLQKALIELEQTVEEISYTMIHSYKPWHQIATRNLNALWKIRAFKAMCALGLLTASYGALYCIMMHNEQSKSIIS